jgi:hypothetical protein
MSSNQLSDSTVLIRTSQLPAAELGPQDTVLLDAEKGVYYGLEGPARVIWDMLENECTVDGICNSLLERYDIDAATCTRDTMAFLEELLSNGLVSIR